MKRNVLIALFVGFCLVFAWPAMSQARVIKLTMADQNSEIGWGPVHALQPWVKQVEEAAGGRVQIRVYYSQTLCKGKDMWSSVKSGIADIGWCFHGYWPGLTPLADAISLPALPYKTAEKGSEVLWRLYEKFPSIQKEFADNKVLLLYTSTPYSLITTKKQVKTLEDIKGMKIRMTGGPPTEMMKALGGVPMLIPMPDNYIALQKGTIDGMGAPWEAILSFRLYEVARYMTELPFPATYFSISMNKGKWDSLPKNLQDAFMSVSALKGSKFWGQQFFDAARAGVSEKAKEMGIELVHYSLPPAERARWTEVGGKPIWEAWVKKMEREGRPDARAILNATLDLLE